MTAAISRFARFVAVGALNTGLGYAVYALLLGAGLDFRIATTVAFCVGLAVGFRAHSRLVFGAPGRFERYASSWIAIYLAHLAALTLLVRAGVDAYLAGAILLVPNVALSFVVMRYYVFGAAQVRER